MILKTKDNKVYKVGDTKIVHKFSWIPKWVEDKLIWLEHYESKVYLYPCNNWVEENRKYIKKDP
jgi:hypothetical protein